MCQIEISGIVDVIAVHCSVASLRHTSSKSLERIFVVANNLNLLRKLFKIHHDEVRENVYIDL